jgi:hypothetical protein
VYDFFRRRQGGYIGRFPFVRVDRGLASRHNCREGSDLDPWKLTSMPLTRPYNLTVFIN